MKEQKPRKNMKKGKKFISEPELVAKLYNELIEDYGYNPAQIKTEYRISGLKMERVVADIAIFKEEDTSELETIIEVHSSLRPMEDNSIDYFFEVLAESKAEYGMFYNGFKKTCFKKVLGDQIIETDNIPSKQKIKKTEEVDVKLKFWKIFEHLRRKIPSSEYSKILTSLLYVKFYDEKYQNGDFFKTLTDDPVKNETKLHAGFQEVNDEFNILNNLSEIEPKLLSLLLFEMQNLTIKKIEPEVIAYEFFEIQEQLFGPQTNNTSEKYTNYTSNLPKIIIKLMYLYLMHKDSDYKKDNLKILSAYNSDKTYFNLIDFSSDYLDITGENLKKYCEEKITVIEKDISTYSSLDILLKIKGYSPKLILNNPLNTNFNEQFDLILATPPITQHRDSPSDIPSNSENNLIQKLLQQLKTGGLMSIIVPPSFLFHNKYSNLRKFLIENITVLGIIKLPNHTLMHTGIRPIILFLENSKPPKNYSIFMSDLDIGNAFGYSFSRRTYNNNSKIFLKIIEKFIESQHNGKISDPNVQSFYVSSSELTNNDWSINNKVEKLYKLQNPKNIQFIKNNETFNGAKLIFGKNIKKTEFNETEIPKHIKISEINKTGQIKTEFQQQINQIYKDDPKITFVKVNDILLSIRGTIGKVAIVDKKNVGAIIDSRFVIIRSKNKKDSEYLFNILTSSSFQEQVKGLSTGMFIPNIRHKHLEKIYFVPIEEEKIDKITKLRREIEMTKEKLYKNEEELENLLREKNDS